MLGGFFKQATAADVARCIYQGAEEVVTVLLDGTLGKRVDHLQGDVKEIREDVNDRWRRLRKAPH